jgi:SAM-dependent MidA family methyltransferase
MTMPEIIAVERSEHMRCRQKVCYQDAGFDVQHYAELADVKTDKPVLMMCNELPDAFPVKVFEWRKGEFYERGVEACKDGFAWKTADIPMQAPPNIDKAITQTWEDGYISEYNPALAAWQYDISQIMSQGFVFCVDYGYTQREYYRANRVEGTLMGHKKHQVVEDVLQDIGLCDMTAHVDFSALARCGRELGLQACAFMTQGGWLAQSPSVQQAVVALAQESSVESMQALAHAKRMMLPFGMGESFKLLVQGKRLDSKPDYLQGLDRLRDLDIRA